MHIDRVESGQIVARTIFQENGSVLLGEGVELNNRYIERLRNLGIDYLFVEDGKTDDIYPEETVSEETRRQAVQEIYNVMHSFKNAQDVKGRVIEPDMGRKFRHMFSSIMTDLSHRSTMLVNLETIHSTDSYLFQHSFNVAVLAGIVGLAKGLNRNQMEELGVGALLFDIGMSKVPASIINKKGPLTKDEYEIVQAHPKEGFNILRKHGDISLLSAHCALQHHERYNGTGYPRQLEKDEIHLYAQIVGLADTFDALTSNRPYRKRYTVSEAIEFLFAAGGTYFDHELIKLFCSHISIYPVATTLLLNTGQLVVVSENNTLALHRPTVRVIKEADGSVPAEPYEIELKDRTDVIVMKEL